MSKPRVFVLEPCKQDLSCAEDFGDLIYVFPADGTRASIWHECLGEQILRKMDALRYNPAQDYIVIAGPMVLQIVAIGTLVGAYRNIKVLLYDSAHRHYVARTIGEHYNAA